MNTSLKPVIHFTEENWRRMKEDSADTKFWDAECYGTISIGGVHADIDLFENYERKDERHTAFEYQKPTAGCNLYIRGFDDGYGVDMESSPMPPYMPYSLCSGNTWFEIPLKCKTFEKFKEKLAENFINYCAELKQLVESGKVSVPGELVEGCTGDIDAILAGANGIWA